MSDDREWLGGRFQVKVYYEDTDFSGYVYHANYLKYFERAREELVGPEFVRELYDRGIHYVVSRADVSYHHPARHADLIEVRTQFQLTESPVVRVKQTAFRIDNVSSSESPSAEHQKLVSATIKLVSVNNDGLPTRVPSDVRAKFATLAKVKGGDD